MVPSVSARAHTLKLATAAPRWAAPVVNRRIAPAQPVRARQPAQSAHLSATDPRWVFALRAALGLSGGRAAILTPDKRRGLDDLARRMGLRPFDAALVIAIVQDAARRGESIADRGGSPAVAARLSLVRPADVRSDIGSVLVAGWVVVLTSVLFTVGWLLLNW